MTATLRALLALMLLAGLYVLVAIVVAVNVAFVVVPVVMQMPITTLLYAVIVTVPPTVATLCGVLWIHRSVRTEPGSVPVPADQAPELWRIVAEFAGKVGTSVPAELRIMAKANATVTEKTRLLGLVGGARRMDIGVPLLIGLSSDEVRAILCHELGHYSARHVRFGSISYRCAVRLDAMRDNLQQTARSMWSATGVYYQLLNAYVLLYLRLTRAVRQRQETEADNTAADKVGAGPTIAALKKTQALIEAWQDFLNGYVSPVRKAGFMPDDIFGAFQKMLSDDTYKEIFALRINAPEEKRQPAGPTTHASLAERISRIQASHGLPAELTPDPATPAIDHLLTEHRQELLPALQHTMQHPDQSAPTLVPWERWAQKAVGELTRIAANDLIRAAGRTSGTSEPTLAAVLSLLESKGSQLLARQLTGPGPRPAQDHASDCLRDALHAVIGRELTREKHAEWQLSWTSAGRLVNVQAATTESIETLVYSAVTCREAVQPLRQLLIELGVSLDTPLMTKPSIPAPDGAAPNARTVRIRRDKGPLVWVTMALAIALMIIGDVQWAWKEVQQMSAATAAAQQAFKHVLRQVGADLPHKLPHVPQFSPSAFAIPVPPAIHITHHPRMKIRVFGATGWDARMRRLGMLIAGNQDRSGLPLRWIATQERGMIWLSAEYSRRPGHLLDRIILLNYQRANAPDPALSIICHREQERHSWDCAWSDWRRNQAPRVTTLTNPRQVQNVMSQILTDAFILTGVDDGDPQPHLQPPTP